MESARQSAGALSDLSTDSSTSRASSPPYADVESGSRFDLVSCKNSSSSSSVFPERSSTIKILSIVSLFVSILCLLCIGAFCCWVFVFHNGLAFPQTSKMVGGRHVGEAEVCVPCLQVSPDPLDSSSGWWELMNQLDVRYGEENDTKICCAVDANQYAVLFKLILQRQQEVQKLAAFLESTNDTDDEITPRELPEAQQMTNSLSSVSAHLVFKPPAQQSTDREDPTVQQWKSPAESPMSHVQKGLKFHNQDRILVQTPGLYYVYCQFLYSPSYTKPTTPIVGSEKLASAHVRRYSILQPSSPSFLLKSRHTRADLQEDRHSSYAGGVFRLHKGDSLYVQVSRPDFVSHDDVASFFGLFKVGP